jgi:hypothetical protein
MIAALTKIIFRVAHQKRSNTRCTCTADHLPFAGDSESADAVAGLVATHLALGKGLTGAHF